MTKNGAEIFNALRSYALSISNETDANPTTVELMTATSLGEMWLKARDHNPIAASAHAFFALIDTAGIHNERLFSNVLWDRKKIEKEAERCLSLAYGIALETGLDTTMQDSRVINLLKDIQYRNPYVIKI